MRKISSQLFHPQVPALCYTTATQPRTQARLRCGVGHIWRISPMDPHVPECKTDIGLLKKNQQKTKTNKKTPTKPKTPNVLTVDIKNTLLTTAQIVCDSTERFRFLKHSATSAVGSLITLVIYFKADAQRRINTLSNKIIRNSPEGMQGWHRLDWLNANKEPEPTVWNQCSQSA